jgi:hypothetical protein
LVAVLSFVAAVVIVILSSGDPFSRMGNLTGWSVAFFLSTLLYALASGAGAVAVWRAPKHAVRAYVRIYSVTVILALLIAAAYLVYWRIIGLRTWA